MAERDLQMTISARTRSSLERVLGAVTERGERYARDNAAVIQQRIIDDVPLLQPGDALLVSVIVADLVCNERCEWDVSAILAEAAEILADDDDDTSPG